jgi:hypothetical protein
MIFGMTGSCQSWWIRDAISGSNTNPSAVPPPLPIPLTSTPLTTVAEPGTVLADDFLLRVDGSVVMR